MVISDVEEAAVNKAKKLAIIGFILELAFITMPVGLVLLLVLFFRSLKARRIGAMVKTLNVITTLSLCGFAYFLLVFIVLILRS